MKATEFEGATVTSWVSRELRMATLERCWGKEGRSVEEEGEACQGVDVSPREAKRAQMFSIECPSLSLQARAGKPQRVSESVAVELNVKREATGSGGDVSWKLMLLVVVVVVVVVSTCPVLSTHGPAQYLELRGTVLSPRLSHCTAQRRGRPHL